MQKPSRAIWVSGAALFLLVVAVVVFVSGRHTVKQPIEYNHKIHVESAGLNCVDCHKHAEQLAAASLPALEVCANCHSDAPISQSPEEVKLLQYVSEQKDIPWVQVHEVPDHVYFSHRRHVVGGELNCSECHGDVGEMTKPFVRAAYPIEMETCMACHKKMNITNDCLICHR